MKQPATAKGHVSERISPLNIVTFRRSSAIFGRFFCSPFPAADGRHVIAMFLDVLFVFDQLVVDRLLEVGGLAPSCGKRSITSSTRWKRSRSFITTMSNGVVVVPSSLKPRTCMLLWLVRR